MANKAKKNNKNIIIGACAACVVVALIIIAIVFAINNNQLNDSYFVSDGTKYVLTLDTDTDPAEEHTPEKIYLVYTYSGDNITGLKAYYKYTDEETAKSAQAHLEESAKEAYKSITVNGKYVVLEANESEYEGLTATDVKQQVELMEMLENANSTDDRSDATEEEPVVEETTVEEEIIVEEPPFEESTTE